MFSLVLFFLFSDSLFDHSSYFGVSFINVDSIIDQRLFQVISAITTTGLQTSFPKELHNGYNAFGTLILTVLMIIGAGTGSTGGGIKWQRIGIMGHSIQNEVISLLEKA